MKKSQTIFPLAYEMMPNQTCTLYYLGFPNSWKTKLLEIERKNSNNYKNEYNLPTQLLKKLINNWLGGVINLSPLNRNSNDEHWLTSCNEYSDKDIQNLCKFIKVWVKTKYITSNQSNSSVKELAKEFCEKMNWEDLKAIQSSEKVCLTLEDGTVNEAAYGVIPLFAINRLLGKEITLNGVTLRLCHAAKNQLVSNPITDPKTHHKYSFVFDLSVQTIPPKRKALLLCHMSIRRWIPDIYNKENVPFLENKISAHIKISENKYCRVHISYDKSKKQVVWKEQDEECYNILEYDKLPSAEDVVKFLAEYTENILLPYKNGMSGFVASKIGTGVSVVDKASLYNSIFNLLGDMVCNKPVAERIGAKRGQQTLQTYKSPQEYESLEDFRSWVSKCAETDKITFELYGLWGDDSQRHLLEQIENKIKLDFGDEKETSCLKVTVIRKNVGSIADKIIPSDNQTIETKKINRRNEIVEQLDKIDAITACIFVLPGKDDYREGDPKSVIRNAFAATGRVIQFINPISDSDKNNSEKNKIDKAVYDLYRQLGVVSFIKLDSKQPDLIYTLCVGMHTCTQVRIRKSKKIKYSFPLYVIVNLTDGRVLVECEAFSSKQPVSYRLACLEMSEIFWESGLNELSKTPAKHKLIDLKNNYDKKEDRVLMLVPADSNTRKMWSGISDKDINGYSMEDKYIPSKINVGNSESPYDLILANSGVRIIRIRNNQEVADYYTGLSSKATDENMQRSSTTGVFKYEDVYWGIHERLNDPRYKKSLKESKIDCPEHSFDEKDMIELYPLQLQSGDNADRWIYFAKALSDISIQYGQSTALPLPLHLAKCLEEYLFEPYQ